MKREFLTNQMKLSPVVNCFVENLYIQFSYLYFSYLNFD